MGPIGWVRSGVLAGGLAALAGCGIVDAMKADLATSPPPGAEQAALPPGDSDYPPNAGLAKGVPAPLPGLAKAAPAPLPETKPVAPERLVGMTQDEARVMLGTPARQRSDPPATVWTWRNSDCQLDLFFYMDVSTRTLRALTYEFTGGQRQSACLGALNKVTGSGGHASQ